MTCHRLTCSTLLFLIGSVLPACVSNKTPGATADASTGGETTTAATGTGESTGATATPTTGDGTTTQDPTTDEPPLLPCDVTIVPGDHAAATCPSGPCPISADVEIHCDQYSYASYGVRVAATPDAIWAAATTSQDGLLYRIVGDAAERVGLPARFHYTLVHLAVGPGGDLHVAAEVARESDDDAVLADIAYLSEAGGWSEQVARTGAAGEPLAGFQVLPDGVPHIWHFGDPSDQETWGELVPDGQGPWTSTPVEIAAGSYGIQEFGRDGLGRLLAADLREISGVYRLDVAVDGVSNLLGKSLNPLDGSKHFFLAPSASPTPPAGPAFAALIELKNGIEVAWPIDATTSDATVLTGFTPLQPQCAGDYPVEKAEACGPPCVDKAAGFERRTAALARTPDGLAWAVVFTTELDHTVEYTKECYDADEMGEVCDCRANVTKDASRSTIHLLRVTTDGADAAEVLTMPVQQLGLADAGPPFADSLVGTHAHAFADSLAIGLRLRGATKGEFVVRALRVELTPLLP